MTFAFGESGQDFDSVLILSINATNGSRRYTFPFINTSGAIVGNCYFTGTRTVTIKSTSDLSEYYAYYYIKYTVT